MTRYVRVKRTFIHSSTILREAYLENMTDKDIIEYEKSEDSIQEFLDTVNLNNLLIATDVEFIEK